MKKISTKIILAVLTCCIVMSTIVGVTSILRSMTVIDKESRASLLEKTRVYAKQFDENMTVYETTLSNLKQFVDGTIDTKKLKEKGYLENYSKKIFRSYSKKNYRRN